MNVGIVTWLSYYNYGTFLQAYALQTILSNLVPNPKLLDDKIIIEKRQKSRRIITKYLPWFFYRRLVYLRNIIRKKRIQKHVDLTIKFKFESFKETYLDVVPPTSIFECYVAGSDQIWSPYFPLNNDYHKYYYLGSKKGKKIAYAPSLRVSHNNDIEYANLIRDWVNDFNALSAREPHGVQFLKNISSKNVELVLDPTLLLSKEDWILKMELSKNIKSDYCLCYLLTYRADIIEYAREYSEKNGLEMRIIYTDSFPMDLINNEVVIPDPREFLDLIMNCSLVVTDSFHATVFSSIFEKEYVIYQRFVQGTEILQNNRISNFLNLIGSDKGLLLPNMKFDQKDIHKDNVFSKKFQNAKNKSLDFLKNSLYN